LLGRRDATSLGPRLDVLYSPDAFGHPGILPTLAREFGIRAGLVWRGLGGGGHADRDLYRWFGPDGAELLLYHLPPQGYEIGAVLAEPEGLDAWPAIRDQLMARAVTSHVAVLVGADHHAPPASLTAIRDALRSAEPTHEVRISSLAEFFAKATVEVNDLHAIDGALRSSYGHTWTLQGTHATRARLKRRHGAVERYLQRAVEPLTALAVLRGVDAAPALVRAATRTLLQCQFHDTICGCCSDDVAREQEVRLASVAAMSSEVARAAVHRLVGHDPDEAREQPTAASPALVLWNPRAVPQGGVTIAEVTMFRRDILVGPPGERRARGGDGYRPFALADATGKRRPVQLLAVESGSERVDAPRHYPDQDEVDRAWVAFDAPMIPAFGMVGLRPEASAIRSADTRLRVGRRQLSNAFMAVAVDARGTATLTDRRTGATYRDLLALVDEVDDGDSYTPWIVPSPHLPRPRLTGERVAARGPLVGALELDFVVPSAAGSVAVRLLIALHADSPLLHLRFTLDNGATNHRLRLRVPVGAGNVALAGAAFGWEERQAGDDGATNGNASEHRTPTAPAQRYVSAGSGARGLALLAPAALEYEWTESGELFVTLIRSIGELSRETLPARPGHAGWPLSIPDAQEPGRHVVDLALVPAPAGIHDDPGQLEILWEQAFLPTQATFTRQSSVAASTIHIGGPELHGAGLVCTAMKPAESGSGVVLRCVNTEDREVAGRWRFATPVATAERVRADETTIETLPLGGGREIAFTAPARAIVTILVRPPA
jgi:mannosylglycerate hydrolase